MKSMFRKVRKRLRGLKYSFIPLWKLPYRLYRHRKKLYFPHSIEDLKKPGGVKELYGDTIFVLGSGPSILDITDNDWWEIAKHASFAINYSFILEHRPTYVSLEDPKIRWHRNFMVKMLDSHQIRGKFKGTTFMLSDRSVDRFIHPRITPEFFPCKPSCGFYKFPTPIWLEKDRPFTDEDFQKSIIYRGSLSTVLHIIRELGYKKIVLLGVDLDRSDYFFSNYPEMKPYVDRLSRTGKYPSMTPKKGKYRTMEEYLYALNDFLKKEGRELFVQKGSILYPKIRSWEEI